MRPLDEGDDDVPEPARAWVLGLAVLATFTLSLAILVRSAAPLATLAGILLIVARLRQAARWDRDHPKPIRRPMHHRIRLPVPTARPG